MNENMASSAHNPDLDWSQIRETILMLNLAVAQIDQSMNDGDNSVVKLSSSFTALATNLTDIKSSIEQLELNGEQEIKEELTLNIQSSTISALDKVHASIIAFQFYDKLSQRLDHVSDSLASLTQLIADPSAIYSPPKWLKLQQNIRSQYSMEEERQMFDNVISGMPVKQALNVFKQKSLGDTEPENDIELF